MFHFRSDQFHQGVLLLHMQCDPMDLEDIAINAAPELSPFRFLWRLFCRN
jgi:hypothetical protein